MFFKVGQTLVVENIKCESALKNYLLSCGFVSGAQVKILAVSPLKKTFLVAVSQSVVSVSAHILKGIVWKK